MFHCGNIKKLKLNTSKSFLKCGETKDNRSLSSPLAGVSLCTSNLVKILILIIIIFFFAMCDA